MVSVLTVPWLCRRAVQHETLKPMPRALSDAIAQLSVPVDLSSTAPGAVALRATGGCMTYLKRCLIDHALVSLALFFSYHPAEITSGDASSAGAGSAAVAASPSVGGKLPGPPLRTSTFCDCARIVPWYHRACEHDLAAPCVPIASS